MVSEGGGLPPGTQLNGIYELHKLVAVGGMGEVYLGHNIQTGEHVAVKMILPEHARNEIILELFRKEALTLNRLSHEAIVRYYVFTVEPQLKRPYLAMEYVDGPSLARRLRERPLDAGELDVLRRRIASGLHAAHRLGVFHRDVSPDNVILVDGKVENAKIIDFGIAKSAGTGRTLIGSGFAGKLNYVSPEQLGLAGGEVGARSDIYSLGLVLAEAATGEPLPMGGNQAEVLEKRKRLPDLSAVPDHIRPLVEWMLQPDPADRPESMAAVAEWTRPEERRRSRRAWPWLAVAAAAAAGLAVVYFRGPPEDAARPPAQEAPAEEQRAEGRPGRVEQEPVLRETAPATETPSDQPSPPSQNRPPEIGERPDGPVVADHGMPLDRVVGRFDDEAGAAALSLRLEGRPPSGVVLQGAGGVARLAGRPAESGDFSVVVVATDPEGLEARLPLVLRVPPPVPFRDVRDYIAAYDGGACFLARPLDLGEQRARIEVFVAEADPLYRFDSDFKRRWGYEAKIEGRLLTKPQCPLAQALDSVGLQALDNRLRLRIDRDTLRSGETLSGTVAGGAGARLFLFDSQGRVTDLAGSITDAGADARFALPVEGQGPQVLVAAIPEPADGIRPGATLDELLAAAADGRAALALGYIELSR